MIQESVYSKNGSEMPVHLGLENGLAPKPAPAPAQEPSSSSESASERTTAVAFLRAFPRGEGTMSDQFEADELPVPVKHEYVPDYDDDEDDGALDVKPMLRQKRERVFGLEPWSEPEERFIRQRLSMPLEKEETCNRGGPGGRVLSYVEGWRAIDQANKIFGFNGWSSHIVRLDLRFIEENPSSRKFSACVGASVRVTLRDGTSREDRGGGSAEGIRSKAEAITKAEKEAVTDATKRALKNFGPRLGLSLYDREHVRGLNSTPARVATKQAPRRQHQPAGLHTPATAKSAPARTGVMSSPVTPHQNHAPSHSAIAEETVRRKRAAILRQKAVREAHAQAQASSLATAFAQGASAPASSRQTGDHAHPKAPSGPAPAAQQTKNYPSPGNGATSAATLRQPSGPKGTRTEHPAPTATAAHPTYASNSPQHIQPVSHRPPHQLQDRNTAVPSSPHPPAQQFAIRTGQHGQHAPRGAAGSADIRQQPSSPKFVSAASGFARANGHTLGERAGQGIRALGASKPAGPKVFLGQNEIDELSAMAVAEL